MKTPEGFIFTADTMMEFFQECMNRGISDNDEQGRMELLREFVKNKKASYIRDPMQYLAEKQVLGIKHTGGANG